MALHGISTFIYPFTPWPGSKEGSRVHGTGVPLFIGRLETVMLLCIAELEVIGALGIARD